MRHGKAFLIFVAVLVPFLGVVDAGDRREAPPETRQRADQPLDADVVVAMQPVAGTVGVGQRVSLEFTITAREAVGHTPFHVSFDPEVLRFESGDEGEFLGSDGSPTAFISTASSDGGSVVVGLSRLGRADGALGEGQLCTLHFITVGPGDARIAFTRASARDGSNQTLRAAFLPARLIVD